MRTVLLLLGTLLTGLILWQMLQNPNQEFTRPWGADFLNVWAGPRVAAQDLPALFSIPRYMAQIAPWFDAPIAVRTWSYPLYALFFYAPFAALPYLSALLVWSVLGVAAYLLAARHCLKLRSPALLALLAAPCALVTLLAGQNGFFTAALALLALAWLGPRPWCAGICIGLLCIKPQLGLLWPFILLGLGAWRSFAAASLTVLALVATSLALHGVDAWADYLPYASQLHSHFASDNGANGLRTYQLMMLSPMPALRLLGLPVALASLLQLAISLIAAICCVVGFRRHADAATRCMLLGSACLLATPYAFNYDAGLLTAGCLAGLWAAPRLGSTWHTGLLAACYLLPGISMLMTSLHAPAAPLLLLAFCIYTAQRSPQAM